MAVSTVFKLTRWAVFTAAVLTAIAMLLYPGGTSLNRATRGYSFFLNSMSDLGSTVAWSGQANRGSLFLLAASVILVPAGVGCFIVLTRVYSSSRTTSWLARMAGSVVLLAGAGLIGASLAPHDRYSTLHGQFTLLAVGACPVATALLSVATALNARFRRRVPIGWLALTCVVVSWTVVMPARPTTNLELAISVTLQKMVFIALLAAIVFQGYEAERVVTEAFVRRAV